MPKRKSQLSRRTSDAKRRRQALLNETSEQRRIRLTKSRIAAYIRRLTESSDVREKRLARAREYANTRRQRQIAQIKSKKRKELILKTLSAIKQNRRTNKQNIGWTSTQLLQNANTRDLLQLEETYAEYNHYGDPLSIYEGCTVEYNVDDIVPLENVSTLLMNPVISMTEGSTVSEVDAFFTDIANTMKRFSLNQQHLAKTKIFDVVSKIELELSNAVKEEFNNLPMSFLSETSTVDCKYIDA